MKIKNIKKQKNGKYKLKLEDNSVIELYDDVILNNNLLFDQNIDSSNIDQINVENEVYSIYNEVLKYAGKRVRSKHEMDLYLNKFNIDDSIKKKIIDKLINNGIIDDINYTRSFIHDRMLFSSDGPNKIKSELLKSGIDETTIEDEFCKIDINYFDEKYKKIVLKKINNSKYSNNILKRKIANEMNMLGYDNNNIDIFFDNNNELENLELEYNKLYKKFNSKYNDIELENILFKKLYSKGFNKDDIWKFIKKDKF